MTLRTTLPRLLAVTAAAAALGLGLAGCATINQVVGEVTNQTSRDEDGQVTEGNDDADVFDIQVGDCIDSANLTGEVETVPQVPCSEPHDSEAFASLDLEDGDFPGQDAIDTAAADTCAGPDFEEYVGIAYEESTLSATYLYPTEMSWAQGDREILCLVYDEAGQTTGTLKGSAR